MITTPSPDRTSVQLEHEEIALDARHVRSCPRALVYAGRNEPTTDETPADQQNGLAIQRALAEPTVDALVREGWEMKWVRRSGQLHDPSAHTNWAPLKGVRVHGLPDALGRGEATGWQAAPVVSVSGPRMRDPYSEWCSAAAHTHNQGLPEGSPLVIASLNLETGRLDTKVLEREGVKWLEDLTLRGLEKLGDAVQLGILPEPLSREDDPECLVCPWRSGCRRQKTPSP